MRRTLLHIAVKALRPSGQCGQTSTKKFHEETGELEENLTSPLSLSHPTGDEVDRVRCHCGFTGVRWVPSKEKYDMKSMRT